MSEDSFNLIPDLDNIICDVLKEEFDVKICEKGHYWFTPWENHCRKVFNLYLLKGNSHPLYWGYNFDFIPWENCMLGINPKPWNVTGKLVYHRTEKSIKMDFYGTPFPYIGYNFYSPSLHSYEEHNSFRRNYFVNAYGDNSKENIELIRTVVKRNIPFMLDWFEKNKTLDNLIDSLTREIIECENNNGFPFGAYWVRGFLNAKHHNIESAISDIARVYKKFDPPAEIPEKVLKKIYDVDKM